MPIITNPETGEEKELSLEESSAQRFQTVYSIPFALYTEGAPVIVSFGTLIRNNINNQLLMQLGFRSISPSAITFLRVEIFPKDGYGMPVGNPVCYNYSSLSASRDQSFGEQYPIPIPYANTASFDLIVSQVAFADGSFQSLRPVIWTKLETPFSLETAFSTPDAVARYRNENGADCQVFPLETRGLWYCTCGALNGVNEPYCHCCRRELFWVRANGLNLSSPAFPGPASMPVQAPSQVQASFGVQTPNQVPAVAPVPVQTTDPTTKSPGKKVKSSEKKTRSSERKDRSSAKKDRSSERRAKSSEKKEKSSGKKKKPFKVILLTLLFLLLAGGGYLGVTRFLIPEIRFQEAISLFEEGHFTEAALAFGDLGSFSDCPDRVRQCMYHIALEQGDELMAEGRYDEALTVWTVMQERYSGTNYSLDVNDRIAEAEEHINENKYNEACALYDARNYDAAQTLFTELAQISYRDSEARAADCAIADPVDRLNEAILLGDSGDYENALIILNELMDEQHEDALGEDISNVYYITCLSYALSLYDQGDYVGAAYYLEIDGVDADPGMVQDCHVQIAAQQISEGRFEDAINELALIPDFEGTPAMLLDAKYGYVRNHMNTDDDLTYSYLQDLMAENYEDSADLYQDLYGWHVTGYFNESSSSTIPMTSVNKNFAWYLHIEITGGEPGEYVDINSIATFPTGSTTQVPLVGVWDGFSGVNYYWYDTPAYGYTGTFTVDFYDPDGKLLDSLSVELTN